MKKKKSTALSNKKLVAKRKATASVSRKKTNVSNSKVKLTKQIEAEILYAYNTFWDANLAGNMETFASYLVDDFSIFGSATGEIFLSKEEAVGFYTATADQMKGKAQLRNRKISVQPFDSNSAVIREESDLYVLIENVWTFYGHARISCILQHTNNGWKAVHQHASFPDHRTEEGQQIAVEKIEKENLELREAVKRRTVELEQKNRELEIEASLERVRARAMSMQHSYELSDLIGLIYKELTRLDVVFDRCFIMQFDEQGNAVWWMASPESPGGQKGYFVKYHEHKPHLAYLKGFREQVERWDYTVAGREKKAWDNFIFSETDLVDFPAEAIEFMKAAKSAFLTASFNRFGCLTTGSFAPLETSSFDILLRFSKMFEQTYTRFLDLQKAEAQAREAQIQLALERVRAKTMAMQKSDELREVVATLYEQLQSLDFKHGACTITIMDEASGDMDWWMSGFGHDQYPESYHVKYFNHPCYEAQLSNWRKREKFATVTLSGKEKKNYDKVLFSQTDFKKLPVETKTIMTQLESVVFSLAYMKYGALTWGPGLIPEESAIILQRFSDVFEQTYTRFLDLQKAEAQAREAQIEAALEKVRSRSLAMHHSDELKEVMSVMFKKLTELEILIGTVGILLFDEKTKSCDFWLQNQHQEPGIARLPYDEKMMSGDNYMRAYWDAKTKGESFFNKEQTIEQKNRHFEYVFAHNDVPQSVREYLLQAQYHTQTFIIEKNSALLVDSWDERIYSKEQIEVLKRVAKVFEQAYVRFLDLQKAEEQAREAKVENALERLRSRTMSMQASDELNDVISIVYAELIKLDRLMDRCFIMTFDAKNFDATWWMASGDEASYQTGLLVAKSQHAPQQAYIDGWMQQMEKWEYLYEGDEKSQWDGYLYHETELRLLPEIVKHNMKTVPRVYLSGSFQKFGCLTTGSFEPLSDQAFDLLVRFAKVFEQTYTRFLDLQKAEAQAREAQIELALERVRAKTMAMQHSGELAEAATLLFQQIKDLDIEAWTTGFNVWINGDTAYVDYVTNPDGGFIEPYIIDLTEFPAFIEIREAKLRGDEFFVRMEDGEQIKATYKYLMSHAPGQYEKLLEDGFPFPTQQWEHFVFGKSVSLMFITYGPVPEAHDIFKRFGKVFEQTYTRFLDLQKAEAQAREAQIEAALEKIRSRSLAMHHSNELREVIAVFFEKLNELKVLLGTVGITLLDHKSRDIFCWVGNSIQEPQLVSVPYSEDNKLDETFLRDTWVGMTDKTEFINKVYTKEQKDRYFEHLFYNNDLTAIPESAREVIRNMNSEICCFFPYNNFGLFADSWDGRYYTEADISVIRRAGKVFEQAYIRFLDIQKAEAQAREAQIEAALERVRSSAMAMHSSQELANVVLELRKQMGVLGQKDTDTCVIHLHDISPDYIHAWAALRPPGSDDEIALDTAQVPKKGIMIIEEALAAYSRNEQDYGIINEGKKIEQWLDFIKKVSPVASVVIEQSVKSANPALPKSYWSFSDFNGGSLLLVTTEPPIESARALLRRFSNVFGLAYRRFADLKQAEAQAREAQIEAALERVRSRTMAMHNSSELIATAEVIFEQLKQLGAESLGVAFAICESDNIMVKKWTNIGIFSIPYTDEEGEQKMYEAWKNQKELHEEIYEGERIQRYYELFLKFPAFKEGFDKHLASGYILPSWQKNHAAIFKYGYLLFITTKAFEETNIFVRFAKVFEQTYTRFLDLQKAEAQAREAYIETALERVRSRTMAMQRSEELADAASLLFKQVIDIKVNAFASVFHIWQSDGISTICWANGADGLQPALRVPHTEEPFHNQIFDAWKRGEDFFVMETAGKELEAAYQFLFKQIGGKEVIDGIEDSGFPIPKNQVTHCVFFLQGYIMFNTYEREPEAHEIFKRFGKVFEQTYTRFLDLQKAEASTRESQIQLALERVRAKTMAMQHSGELREIAAAVHDQLLSLGFTSGFCSIVIIDSITGDMTWWMFFPGKEYPESYHMPFCEHPFYLAQLNHWKQGEKYSVVEASGEEKRSYDKHVFSRTEFVKIPIETQQFMMSFEKIIFSNAYMKHGSISWGVEQIDDEHAAVLQRFASVFEQCYTRFLDLQKAEVQAKEAIKRSSVDRVRAEIASMRTTHDLERITPLIWNELISIGVPSIRCGVFIMDDAQEQIHTFLSTPDGKAIGAFHLPYTSANLSDIVQHWRDKKIYKTHWGENEYALLADELIKQNAIASRTQFLSSVPTQGIFVNYVPFLQGMLYVGNTSLLSEDDLKLVQALADSFSTAYARYEDFVKLELAKKQVEKTLSDLKLTQAQLVQSEKMASLGELTAGIAHEIQNPLNFVNNFSEVSTEMIKEIQDERRKTKDERDEELENDLLKDISENMVKINLHGKRAADIVKGMLQHSRSSSGVKEPTDINALADEYLRLAYHGLRAKDKSFNATMKTDFDETIGSINIIPQDIGRVILNLITNAFYAVNEKAKQGIAGYEPTVSITTKRSPLPGRGAGGEAIITVKDNGNGIPDKIKEKIFQPFFTTKPTGQGTGLGLSLSYDIVKAHGGEIVVNTNQNGSEFIIKLPYL
jgi:signal transduction histidine kinase